MTYENLILEDLKGQKEYQELKDYLKIASGSSEHDLIATWRCIKHMQSALDLPPHTSIEDLVKLFNNLEDVRKTFNFHVNKFVQLYEIFCEINSIRQKLHLPDFCSTSDVLSQIERELVPFLGLKKDSLLKQLLKYYLPIKNQV
ncbi:MAG: hypothetical protein ACFFB2_16475 [Promethearchaeota archaeon]